MSSAEVQKIIEKMGHAFQTETGLGGTLKLDFGEAGSILIDGTSSPNTVSDGTNRNADCTINVSLDIFERLAKRQIDPTAAFMQGKLRVAGDMAIAMKLGSVFQKSVG